MVTNTSSGYGKERVIDSVPNLACRSREFVYLIFFPYLSLLMTVFFSSLAVHIKVSKVSTTQGIRRMGCNLEVRNCVTRKKGRSPYFSIKYVSIVVHVASTVCVDMKTEFRTWCVLVRICVHERRSRGCVT